MRSFLWRYFRRYAGWGALALVATFLYSGTTVLVYALLRPIFSDVLQADGKVPGALGMLVEADGSQEGEEARRVLPEWLERLKDDLDPQTWVQAMLDQLRTGFGIEGARENLTFLAALFALVIMVRSLAGFVNGYFFQVIGLGGTNDLRNDLYRHILKQSSRFFAEHPSGELLSRVGNDIQLIQLAISTRLIDLFQQSLTLFGLLYFLFALHWRLALMCFVIAPAIVYPIVRFGKGMRKTSHHTQERMADLSNLVAEAVRGHRVVKAFGMETFEQERFEHATRRHFRTRLRAQMLRYASGPVVESLAAIGAAFFLIYAGNSILDGTLQTSEMMTFMATMLAIYDPIRKLNKVNLIFQEALAAADRVKSVMEIPNDIEDRPDAREMQPMRAAITFEGVSFSYGNKAALTGIDLDVNRGEVVALVGSSGAGKSTLVNLLPRFFDPDAGRVAIDGVDLRDLRLESLRAAIGIVTQDTVLFNDTVRNNIAYGRADLSIEAVERAAGAAYADRFIEALEDGYDAIIGEGGHSLSGGERQRLAIARALLKDPPILILDEATSHLDTESEALVQQALGNLMEGRTALVIAHRLSTVHRADRIVVMSGGQVVEQGTHASLLAAGGRYRRLYDLQFRDKPSTASSMEPQGDST